jgi:Mn2+/Fe2+ NRAMP family transporter
MMVGSSERHDTLPAGGSRLSEPKPPAMSFLKLAGPGLIVAATGIGSGDVVSATVGGARYGVALLWAIALGAFFKFVLS